MRINFKKYFQILKLLFAKKQEVIIYPAGRKTKLLKVNIRQPRHIPIVSPDALDSDLVDAVIVMAAGYSNKVSKIIQQKFNRKINVFILRDYGLERV